MFDWIRLYALAQNGSKKSTCNHTACVPAWGSGLLSTRSVKSPKTRLRRKLWKVRLFYVVEVFSFKFVPDRRKKKKSFQFLKAETIIFGMMFGISMMLLYKQAWHQKEFKQANVCWIRSIFIFFFSPEKL